MTRAVLAGLLVTFALGPSPLMGRAQRATPPAPAAGPVMVIDTAKGSIEIQLFKADAPKSVDHVLGLVKSNFYRGLRVHRVEKSLVQFGDPQSRDMSQRAAWGSGGSGTPVGVAELSRKHLNVRGAVGLAHGGNPKFADSQLYILKTASPSLDGKHVVIGQVVKGMDVVDKLDVPDVLRLVTIR